MIKKFLTFLLFSCLIFLGNSFVSAVGYYGTVSSDLTVSNYNSNYNLTVLSHGNFESQYLGSEKMLFMPGKGNFIFWSEGGLPYIYHSSYVNNYEGAGSYTWQGYATKYYVCNDLSSFSSLEYLDCENYNIDSGSVITFSNYLQNYNFGDYYYYYWGFPYVNAQTYGEFLFCFTKSLSGDSALCFGHSSNPSSDFYDGISNGAMFDSDRNNVAFDTISSAFLKSSPYVPNNSNNDYVPGIIQNQYDNVTYGECTNGQGLQYYRNTWGFNDLMCYGGVSDRGENKSTVTPGRGFTVFDIYNRQNVEVEGGTLFDNFCDWYNTMEWNYNNDPSIFSGTSFIYKTYWDILYANDLAWGCEDVYNYCSLLLRSNLNASLKDNPYLPEEDKNNLCKKVVDTSIWTAPVENTNGSGINGSVISSNWNGVGAFSGNLSGLNIVTDGKNFINQFFSYAKSGVVTNFSGSNTGIIPWYIMVVLLGLIFFRFLSH